MGCTTPREERGEFGLRLVRCRELGLSVGEIGFGEGAGSRIDCRFRSCRKHLFPEIAVMYLLGRFLSAVYIRSVFKRQG
jgi:hypothetical protein